MVKLLNTKKYISSENTIPLKKSHTNQQVLGGSVMGTNAIRCKRLKAYLPHGPDYSHQSVEEWHSTPVAGTGRSGPHWLEDDGCPRVGLDFWGLVMY